MKTLSDPPHWLIATVMGLGVGVAVFLASNASTFDGGISPRDLAGALVSIGTTAAIIAGIYGVAVHFWGPTE